MSYFQGRWSLYVPTVSETAIGFPNSLFFAVMLGIDAIFICLMFILYRSSLILNQSVSDGVLKYGNVLTYVCPLQLIILSSCTIKDSNSVHFGNAVPFFIVVSIYFLVSFIQMKNTYSKFIYIFRYVSLIVLAVSFLSMGLVFLVLPDPDAMTPHSYSEFVFISTLIIYLMTWLNEIKTIHVQFVVEY